MTKSAKRAAPDPVPPVVVDGVRYEVIHYGLRHGLDQNGGYIVARNVETGEKLCDIKVYEVVHDPKGKEPDSQDVFITSMKKVWFRPRLKVRDEFDRAWTVHLDTRTVTP